ncbi:MAG: FAD-dependent oxidoreductase [Halovenus sp.]
MSSVPPRTTSDVVVVGSGVGGLAGAVTAAANGCTVTVLEKADVLGGSSGLSGAQLWVPANHRMEERGLEDSVDQAVEYMTELAGDFYANPDASRWFVEHASEAVRYFEDVADLSFQVIAGLPDYHDGPGARGEGRYLEPQPLSRSEIPDWADLPDSPHLPGGVTTTEILQWGGALTPAEWDWDVIQERRTDGIVTMGTSLIGHFLRAADSLDIEVHAGTAVTDLVTEAGTVTGVEVAGNCGDRSVVRAREGVLLNTGAYDWNESMIENFEGTPADHVVSAAIPTATGDGLRMAALEGAKLATYPPIGGAKGFFVAVPDTEFLDAPLYRYCYNVGLPHAIAVNAAGERFCDESFYPKQATEFYDPTGEYADMPYYMVFDETYRQTYAIANYKPGTDYPSDFLAARGDTLEELARELGFDPGTLRDTVSRFNGNAREGVDPEYGRGENEWGHVWCGDPTHDPNPNLGPLDSPPFYAVRLYVGLSSMSNTGLVTDTHSRVKDWNEQPIDGLYATGSVCAPVEWGVGYQSGLQNARSLTYGYLAGLHLAAPSGP